MTVNKEQIKNFWENNPLMVGEALNAPGSREFVEEHEKIYKSDIFLKEGIPEEFFPFPANSQVLDIGCGVGMWTRELAKRGYQVSAIDLTNNGVEITKKSLAVFNLSANVQVGDAEELPFSKSIFDGVVCHGVIHHTPNTAQCVSEMIRVLKPGGIAVVSVYYKNIILRSKLLTRLVALLCSHWIKLPGRGRENLLTSGNPNEIVRIYDGAGNPLGKAYTTREVQQMFVDVGFNIISIRRFYFPKRALGPLKFLVTPFHSFLSRHFGLLIAVVAQKA